jgi:UDP-glucose:glycoprotein glucosyltransferase
VHVTAILDPLSESAQRLSPLLKVIRDQLQLPLHVLLTPPLMLEGDAKIPITSYYRFVAEPGTSATPEAVFSHLPSNHVLTLQVDVPEPWNVQQTSAIQDTDNLRCDVRQGCSDDVRADDVPMHEREHVTKVEFGLKNLLIFGQCYETKNGNPPNGLQLTLSRVAAARRAKSSLLQAAEVGMDGLLSTDVAEDNRAFNENSIYSDTLVMKNVGYWQLPANPGIWKLGMAEGSEGAAIFEMLPGVIRNGAIRVSSNTSHTVRTVIMKDFISKGEIILVRRRPGMETAELFPELDASTGTAASASSHSSDDDVIHVFSLATGHLYERFLKIMMLSVTKRTSQKVKFWLFENFLSPTFKASARAMAQRIGCDVEFVTYKWPEWLRGQSEKQRIIWGYKVRFVSWTLCFSATKCFLTFAWFTRFYF